MSQKKKLDEIQKLRAFALFMCCMGHFPFALPNMLVHGYTGVTIFFVISGYVCTRSYLHSFSICCGSKLSDRPIDAVSNRKKDPYLCSALDFWVSRFFRVIPVIVIWLMIFFLVGQMINYLGGSYGDLGRWVKEFKWWFSGAYNYFYAYGRMPGLFGHFWTMAIELQFYLALPFFFFVFRNRRSQTIACVVLILLSSTLFRALTPPEFAGLLTHTQMDSLFLGVLICLWTDEWRPKCLFRVHPAVKVLLSTALILTIYLLPAKLDFTATPIVKYPIFTALAGLLLYLAQLDDGWIMGKNKRAGDFLLKIADVSFSVYLLHVLVFSGLYAFVYYNCLLPRYPQLASHFWVAVQVLVLALVCYWLGKVSVALIERPYAEYGKRVVERMRKTLES